MFDFFHQKPDHHRMRKYTAKMRTMVKIQKLKNSRGEGSKRRLEREKKEAKYRANLYANLRKHREKTFTTEQIFEGKLSTRVGLL